MPSSKKSLAGTVALVTGSARRIGASVASALHAEGANVIIHYRSSAAEGDALVARLNADRQNSALGLQANLLDTVKLPELVAAAVAWQGRLDMLINNASSFYPTPLGHVSEGQWDDLVGSNLKVPLFLAQAALPELRKSRGSIINLIDIHARRPLRDHAVYGAAKAGLAMLTLSLAKDLAPEVRVNGVSPGAILWPEDEMSDTTRQAILDQIPLGRQGAPADIAACILYLVRDAGYVTGQIIAVDGGRSIGW